MSTRLPVIESERLLVRELTLDDLHDIHRVLTLAWKEPLEEGERRLDERLRWLQWTVANYEALASLFQLPYGDRAVVLKAENRLIGAVGLVPSLGPFRQLPGFPDHDGSHNFQPEVGLYWAIEPSFAGRSYGTEAARTLIDHVMEQFSLARVVATTEYTNEASMGVMRKLGMRILSNPLPDPPWFQITGVLERDRK